MCAAGVPEPVVKRLNAEILHAPEEMRAWIAGEVAK